MSEKMSMPDYYYNQRRIAEKYGIADHHAGCYIYHRAEERVCVKCPYKQKCREILEEEEKD